MTETDPDSIETEAESREGTVSMTGNGTASVPGNETTSIDEDGEPARSRDVGVESADGDSGIDERLASLEAELQALRGRVDEVDSVDGAIERKTDAALAAIEGIEDRLDRIEADRSREHRTQRGPPRSESEPSSTDGRSAPEQCTDRPSPAVAADASEPGSTRSRTDRPPAGGRNGGRIQPSTRSDRRADAPQRTSSNVDKRSSTGRGDEQWPCESTAPNAVDGPEADPDERGIVERLRDTL